MVKRGLFSRGLSSIAALCCAQAALGATAADAVDAGRNAANLSWSDVTGNGAAASYLTDAAGDTKSLESLRQNGQAKLYSPGRTEADRCASERDPKCLAVQLVDRGGAERPSVNPDVTGEVIANHDKITANPSDYADVIGAGTETGDCRPAQALVTPAAETKTCDIRVAATSEEKTCLETTETFYAAASRWRCRIDAARTETASCVLPVLPKETHTYTLACREGTRPAETRTCTATVTTSTDALWTGRCVKPQWKAVTKTCTRRLLVRPAATCTVGTEVSARVTDYGFLGEDAVPGADTLELAYRCTASQFPVLLIRTNSATRGEPDRTFKTSEAVFDFSEDHPGATLRLAGTLACGDDHVCQASVTMTVFRGSGRESVRVGEISKSFAFTRFAKTGESEWWDESCTEGTP